MTAAACPRCPGIRWEWLAIASFAVAGVVALLAWISRDRSPRFTAPGDQPPGDQ